VKELREREILRHGNRVSDSLRPCFASLAASVVPSSRLTASVTCTSLADSPQLLPFS